MKLNTVNVVEYADNTLLSVVSFMDNDEGNKEAEDLFSKCAKDNEFSDEDIEFGLEEGYLSHSDGDYELYIIHSS